MAYVKSDKINIFPLSKPRFSSNQKNNRLIGEKNISNIIAQLTKSNGTENDGFVVEYVANSKLLFNINGYYCEVNDSSFETKFTLSESPIWAIIKVSTGDFPEIYGQDNDSNYEGIEFIQSDTKPASAVVIGTSTYNQYSVKLIEKINGDWVIPDNSKIIINPTNAGLNIKMIDAGVIK